MALIPIIAAIVLVIWRARQVEPQGIAPLTSLRGFAAGMVFALHFSENYRADHPDDRLASFLSGGYESVSVFFVLSGFLLTIAIRRDLRAQEFNLRQYFVRRAARIYPLYYVLLAITFLLSPQIVHWQNVLLIHAFFNSAVFQGIPPAWTLTIEESFYVLLPPAIWLCLKIGQSNGLVIWCLGLLGAGFFLVALHIPDFVISLQFMWSRTIFGRFPIFAIGVACAFLYEQRKQWPLSMLIVFIIALLSATCLSVLETLGLDFQLGDILVGLAAGGVILGLASDNRLTRFLGNRYFVYLGLISYALYLIHLSALMIWMLPLVHNVPDLIAAYAVATLLSIACYELIERPARAAILRRFGHNAALSPVTPV